MQRTQSDPEDNDERDDPIPVTIRAMHLMGISKPESRRRRLTTREMREVARMEAGK